LVWLDGITEFGLQTVVCKKKLKSVCSLKGSLYEGRELLSESGS